LKLTWISPVCPPTKTFKNSKKRKSYNFKKNDLKDCKTTAGENKIHLKSPTTPNQKKNNTAMFLWALTAKSLPENNTTTVTV
jgi:hypothetical protein